MVEERKPPFLRVKSLCKECGRTLLIVYDRTDHIMEFIHDDPICPPGFSILVGLGVVSTFDESAKVAACAHFLAGWDVLSWIISQTHGELSGL